MHHIYIELSPLYKSEKCEFDKFFVFSVSIIMLQIFYGTIFSLAYLLQGKAQLKIVFPCDRICRNRKSKTDYSNKRIVYTCVYVAY